MRVVLLICALLAAARCTAAPQKPIVFHADTALRFLPGLPMPALRILDARAGDPTAIGATGASKPTAVVLQEPLETAAASWVRHWGGAEAAPNEGQAVFVVHDFFIQEGTYGAPVRTFHLDADLFTRSGDAAAPYRYVARIDSFWEFLMNPSPLPNRARQLEPQVSKALLQCLQACSRLVPAADAPAVAAADAAGLLRRTPVPHPAFDTSVPPPQGLYAKPADFLRLRPTDTALIYTSYKSMDGPIVHLFYHRKADGEKGKPVSTDAYFALSNGSAWFVGKGRSWSPLIRKDGEFYVRHYLKGLDVQQTPALYGGAGGALGYMFISAYVGARNKQLNWVLYETRFDPDRKAFIPYRRLGIPDY